MNLQIITVKNILTRTTGFLASVTSHSVQPYVGCAFGNSTCGVGCYVRHNHYVTKGREWGEFLDVREDAPQSYLANVQREARWAREQRGEFSIFMSSSTEPFQPAEFKYGVTRRLLEAMHSNPPDRLVIQTHSHRVVEYIDHYERLNQQCRLRVHISIETDREAMPGLPRHASSVSRRFEAASLLKRRGVFTVITVSPLLPIDDPDAFFKRCAVCADATVLDHFIGGDGTSDGRRTLRTSLPTAMAAVNPNSVGMAYRDEMLAIARRHIHRVGVNIDGFAARYLPAASA